MNDGKNLNWELGNSTIDDVLETLELNEISNVFRIEIEIDDGGISFDFPA
jgi:hypothetical protein